MIFCNAPGFYVYILANIGVTIGDGNGQVPPGQTEDEDGTIVNNGGNVAPGLNRGEHIDKPDTPNKPDKPAPQNRGQGRNEGFAVLRKRSH